MLAPIALCALLAGAGEEPGPGSGGPWEPISPDFSNIRGVNYIPEFPSLTANPPDLGPELIYYGVASSVAAWRFYVSEDVDAQLGYLKGIGVNAVRVWLSYAVYEEEREGFIDKMEDFMRLAERHRIHVMPILFDYDFVEPTPGSEYDDVYTWVRSPSISELTSSDFRSRPGGGDEYVTDVVKAIRSSPALLMWDIMNEPPPMEFLDHYLALVDSLDPSTPLTIGFAPPDYYVDETTLGTPYAAHPLLDVMSIHPYGIFRQNHRAILAQMRDINAAHNSVPKPVLITEFGHPGGLQRYEDQLRFNYEDASEHGPTGFFLFQGIVGDRGTGHPFRGGTGLLFSDGEARDVGGVAAFVQLAKLRGAPDAAMPPIKPNTDPKYYPYDLFYVPTAQQVVWALEAWPFVRPTLSDANRDYFGYELQSALLFEVVVSLSRLHEMLSQEDKDRLNYWAVQALPRDLSKPGNIPRLIADGWITLGSNGEHIYDWPKWDTLFVQMGLELADMIRRYGING